MTGFEPGRPAGWYAACGTRESSPLFAGIAVLANQVAGHRLGLINPPCTGWRPGSAQLFVPNWPAPPASRPRSHIY